MPDMIWQGTSQLRKWIEMNEQVMDRWMEVMLVMCVLSLVLKCVHILFDSETGAGKKEC